MADDETSLPASQPPVATPPGVRATVVTLVIVLAIGSSIAMLLAEDRHADKPTEAARIPGVRTEAPSLGGLMAFASKPSPADPTPMAQPPREQAEQVQVCGGDWVVPQGDGSINAAAYQLQPHVREARDRVLASLLADPDPYVRGVALWVSTFDPTLVEAAAVDRWRTMARTLADDASRSDDPRLYGLAYAACTGARNDGACAQLRAEQWARLDPDNGFPWLFVASEAGRRHDDAARDEAIYRLSAAARFDSGSFEAPKAIAARATGDDATLVATYILTLQSLAIQPVRPYAEVVNACRVRMDQDPNRWQTCSAAAALMAERSDSLHDRTVGMRMGRGLEWPLDRLDRLGGEAALWVKHQDALLPAVDDRIASCAGMRRWLEVVAHAARPGAAGTVNLRASAPAIPEDELIRLGRAERERRDALERARPAVAAASAASMPSSEADADIGEMPTVAAFSSEQR